MEGMGNMDNLSSFKLNKDYGAELNLNKQAIVEASASLYRWVLETEEKAIIETLLLNGGESAIRKLRKTLNRALSMLEDQKAEKAKEDIGPGETVNHDGRVYITGHRYSNKDCHMIELYEESVEKKFYGTVDIRTIYPFVHIERDK